MQIKHAFGFLILLYPSLACWSAESADALGTLSQRLKDAQKELRLIQNDPDMPKNPAQARSVAEAKTIGRIESMLAEADMQIQKLEADSAQLVKQRDELKQVQTNLASGLIGAIVTAIVAVTGALLTAINSKPERDLKRLTVIEKANQLTKSGVVVPDDIASNYDITRSSSA